MFIVELTSYGQSISVSQVTIDGVILLYDYISDISSVSDISSYTQVLNVEACGNITKNIGCVKICDHSSSQYQARTILFYKVEGNVTSIIAGYSQESVLVQKNSSPLSIFIALDFSVFTNGFAFSTVQSGYNNAMQNLDGIVHIDDPNISSDDNYSVYSKSQVDTLLDGKQSSLSAGNGIAISNNTVKTTGIPFGICDDTSTSTAFTVTVPGIYKLEDGVCCMVKNGVVTSAAGFTLNVNSLGGKPCYTNMAAATADTTVFNINYTMLFVYDSTRVEGGCWICYRGYYQSDTDKIGYQLRTNSTLMTVSDRARYYKIYFTSADNTQWVPATSNWVNDATTIKTVNQRPINPFGRIVYTSATTNYTAGSDLAATTIWDQYVVTLGHSFNTTGAALTLTAKMPVYVKCSPQSNGSAIIDSTAPIVQSLPSSNDGKIYILLGIATSATAIELIINHPVYHHDGSGIKLWTGTIVPTKVSQLTNDSGYITSYTETDPTVPSWAKESTKPSYTLDEVSDGTTRVLPTVNDATLTIQRNSTTVDTFSANASSNVTVNISVPTDTGDLTNNAGFLTSADMSNYVTTNTTQTISGEKTFSASDVNLSSGTDLSFIYSDDTAAELYTSSRSTTTTDGQPTSVPDFSIDLGAHTNYTDILDDDDAYHKLHIGYTSSEIAYFGDSGLNMASGKNVYANSFIKSGGTSSQFLKADGSVDSSTYLTSSSLSNYVTINTTQTITGSKTFNSISLLPSSASTNSTIVLDTYHYDNDGTDTDNGEACLRPTADEYADLGDYNHKFNNIWAYNLHGNLDGSASSLSISRSIDGVDFNGSSNIIHYGECSTGASTQIKDVTVSGFNLVTGARISVKFTNSNTVANPQLRVNTSGTNGTAKFIKYRGTSAVSGNSSYYRWQAGSVIEFVYDGANWMWVGFQEYSSSANSSTYALYISTNGTYIAQGYYSNPTRALVPYNSVTTSDLGAASNRWRTLYLSTSISDGTNTFSLPSATGTLALTSDIPEEIFCVSSGQSSMGIDSSNDYRDPIPASDPLSTNPRWASNSVSLLVNQYVNLTTNLRLSVYVPNQEFVGSIAFPIDAQISGYAAYPIYFRGDTSTHNPVVPQGTILRLTFRQNAFYNDFYDLADFGVEHEPIVRVGKTPHYNSDSSYNGALVALRRDNNKFDKLLTISRSGVTTTTTLLDMVDGSPIYASFLGECFAAHPHVPFGMFLNMEYIYSAGQTPSASNVAFDFITSDSSTIADHIVIKTSGDVSHPYRYFQVDNAPVFLLLTTNTDHRISIGGIPAGCEGKLIGFLAAGTDSAGLLRLVNCYNNTASQSSGGTLTEYYGVCSTAENQAAKVVTIPSYTVTNPIVTGTRVIVKFSNTNTASNPTLKVSSNGTNGTAAYILYRSDSSNKVGSSINYYRWLANDIVEFIFDGSYWVWVGFREHTQYANNASSSDYSYQLSDYSDSEYIAADDYNNTTVFVSSTDFLPLYDSSCNLGSLDYKWNCTYTDVVNFGSANSAASTTYTASLQLYNSDTTNYKNGISCTGNFLPSSTNTYNLGSSSLKWKEAYFSGGNSTYYTVVDNSGGEPTIRPSTSNYGYLGTSSYKWYKSYINNLYLSNFYNSSGSYSYTLPSKSGTIALTSDIPIGMSTSPSVKAGDAGIQANSIILRSADGAYESLTTNSGSYSSVTKTVNINGLYTDSILIYTGTTAVSANSYTAINTCRAYGEISIPANFNVASMVSGKPVYLVFKSSAYYPYNPTYEYGDPTLDCVDTKDGRLFLDNSSSTSWWTQTLPVSLASTDADKCKIYVYIGTVADSANGSNTSSILIISQNHPIYFNKSVSNGDTSSFALPTSNSFSKGLHAVVSSRRLYSPVNKAPASGVEDTTSIKQGNFYFRDNGRRYDDTHSEYKQWVTDSCIVPESSSTTLSPTLGTDYNYWYSAYIKNIYTNKISSLNSNLIITANTVNSYSLLPAEVGFGEIGSQTAPWHSLYVTTIGDSTHAVSNIYGTLGASDTTSHQDAWVNSLYFGTSTSSAPKIVKSGSNIEVSGNLLTGISDVLYNRGYDIGSSSASWYNGYIDRIYADSISTHSISITENFTIHNATIYDINTFYFIAVYMSFPTSGPSISVSGVTRYSSTGTAAQHYTYYYILSRGTIITNISGSYLYAVYKANLHFLAGTENVAYNFYFDKFSAYGTAPGGSWKILSEIQCPADGTARMYLVPAVKLS